MTHGRHVGRQAQSTRSFELRLCQAVKADALHHRLHDANLPQPCKKMGSSGSSCNYVQQASDSSEFCAGTADKFPIPCPEATDLRSQQGQVTSTPPLSCTADKHVGYWIGQVLLNIIPFFWGLELHNSGANLHRTQIL